MPNVYQRSPDKTKYYQPGSPGVGNVGSYQVSGIPWMTGSDALATGTEHVHFFPYVTRKISVFNHGPKDLRIHFISKDTTTVYSEHHYLTLSGSNADASDSTRLDLDIKCTEVYLSNASGGTACYEMVAEMTTIGRGQMFELTGEGISTKEGGGANPA